jgi:signal transduction histidine kinase
MVKKLCLFFLCCWTSQVAAQPVVFYPAIDSAKGRYLLQQQVSDKVKTAFFVADNFMDYDHYDSAQVWLNKIADIYTIKKPTLFNYYLLCRQAEVYYYNGLLQLGLQSAQRSLEVATKLNDSLLLADACNMTGLFYSTLNQPAEALPYFHTGIPYSKQPPYPAQYLSLAKPHHLLGNLAEALEKLDKNDSALIYNYRSLQKATEIQWLRGMAVAHSNLGKVYFKMGQPDSSYYHYNMALQIGKTGRDFDVAMVACAGLAQTQNHSAAAREWLGKGFAIMQENPQVNALFSKDFLNMSLAVYEKHSDQAGITHTYATMVKLDSTRSSNNTRQLQNILYISGNNENRLLKLEVAEANRQEARANTWLYFALAGLLLMGGMFFIYRHYSQQKLKLAALRNTISQDLHDDVGATLSSLHIYSSLADKMVEENPEKAKDLLKKITANTLNVMDNMGDIIWAMKPVTDNGENLEAKIKNYGINLLNGQDIACTYHIAPQAANLVKNMNARKHILLIVKEALNNIAKYSKATTASISLAMDGNAIVLTISDDGIGFDPVAVKKGNGLQNMQDRCAALKGRCSIQSEPGKGCSIIGRLPLTSIREAY